MIDIKQPISINGIAVAKFKDDVFDIDANYICSGRNHFDEPDDDFIGYVVNDFINKFYDQAVFKEEVTAAIESIREQKVGNISVAEMIALLNYTYSMGYSDCMTDYDL